MDYLTTFTGKSGRLLRGTANRLWGLGGGGEARQVCFQDYLREPVQGDPGGRPPPRPPPAPSNPEGPGELSLLGLPRGRPRLRAASGRGSGRWAGAGATWEPGGRGSSGRRAGVPGPGRRRGGGEEGRTQSARGTGNFLLFASQRSLSSCSALPAFFT